jgi:hypothetical protein
VGEADNLWRQCICGTHNIESNTWLEIGMFSFESYLKMIFIFRIL